MDVEICDECPRPPETGAMLACRRVQARSIDENLPKSEGEQSGPRPV